LILLIYEFLESNSLKANVQGGLEFGADIRLQVDRNLMLYLPRLTVLISILLGQSAFRKLRKGSSLPLPS
jgi:hypothetical protein